MTSVHKRYNVVDLRKNHPEKFGRFIMALKNLINSDDWARICGIHGDTFKPSDWEVKCPTDPTIVTEIGETGEPFYCKHSVYSFIAWHTPYVYQFELLLNKYNKSVNDDYITLPWLDLTDFTADFSFLNDPEITIIYDKRSIMTENPLAGAYYYVNGVRTRTKRNGFLNPTNHKQKLQLQTVAKQLNQALCATDYETFSSAANNDVPYCPLETPHNSLHDIIGGKNGNMSSIDIAAFDPIFWLHHCNMDRHYYSWTHRITEGFAKPLYPDFMLPSTYNESCAPFFKDYIYSSDSERYKWGWTNGTGKYMKVCDVLQLNRFPYTYDIITPAKSELDKYAFVVLKDISIPRESMEINVYIYRDGTLMDKVEHYAGSGFWFGINRDEIHCCRCNTARTTIKIDILDYVKTHRLSMSNIGEYKIIIEGIGLLKDSVGGSIVYTKNEFVSDGGACQIIIKN